MTEYSVLYIFIWLCCLSENYVFPTSTERLNSRRIANGYRCPIEDHPYMVSLRLKRNSDYYCGGTLLSESWVLTGADCCAESTDLIAVVGMTVIPIRQMVENYRKVVKKYRHDNPGYNDICLMKLDKPVMQSPKVKYVHLANYLHTEMEIACKNATIIGWGTQDQIKPYSRYDPHLRCAKVSLYDKECALRYSSNVHLSDSQVCYFDNASEWCYGDKGGPLMCNGVQYGILTHGRGCYKPHLPQIYTRVHMYEKFIHDTILPHPDKRKEVSQAPPSHQSTPRSQANVHEASHILITLLYILCIILEVN